MRLLTSKTAHDESGFTLVELMIALALAMLVLFAGDTWLVSASRVVTASTDRSINNAAAQNAVDQLESSVRFATGLLVSNNGTTLDVTNDSTSSDLPIPVTCAEWSLSGTNLVEQTTVGSSTNPGVIATGVSNLSFSAAGSPYDGLVTVTFTINQTNGGYDANGATVDETLSAENMSTPVASEQSYSGCSTL
jgi:prepilin-type N-terminal cleavage/methylation domain-containing protein